MRTFSSPGVLAADEQSMALLATCFVLFFAPQEPAPTAPPTVSTPTPAPATAPAEPDAASRLAALEKAGPKAEAQALVLLANDEELRGGIPWDPLCDLGGERGRSRPQ